MKTLQKIYIRVRSLPIVNAGSAVNERRNSAGKTPTQSEHRGTPNNTGQHSADATGFLFQIQFRDAFWLAVLCSVALVVYCSQ